jgi:hypothetical protein
MPSLNQGGVDVGGVFAGAGSAGCEWATTDYNRGDVVLFDSLCLHQALPNLGETVRLSLDCTASETSKTLYLCCSAKLML